MSGAIFRDPKSVVPLSDDNGLVITQFNTIKGEDFSEISISRFLNMINRKINQYYMFYKGDIDICYKVKVYKLDNDKYKINFINELNKDYSATYSTYYINTNNHSYIQEQLDKFSDITKRHDYEKECYQKIENNSVGSTKENLGYRNYLNKAKKYFVSSIYKDIALLFSLPLTILSIYLSAKLNISFLVPELAICCGISIAANILKKIKADVFEKGLFKNIRFNSLIKKKIKQIEKKLSNRNIKIDSHNEIVTSEKDLYKDGIFNYMHCVREAIDKLDNDEQKKEMLIALGNICDDYYARKKAFDNGKNNGLTLDNTREKIMMDTIVKLQSLEMEIADIINHKNKNNSLTIEKDRLKEELESSLNALSIEENSGYARVYKR